MVRIRCNDVVIVITGRDKGKRGKVKRIFSSLGKALVDGVCLVYKHQKSIPDSGKVGGILRKESVIDISNLAIFNGLTNNADRIGYRFIGNKKIRCFKSSGKVL
ncbi:MAG: 50S ribosomal subunit protein L24 [Candidatus Westeberhardia cardiocondylae]|nr:50S ribosomal subunit protein L24 [Candidatus Westeberhardia cardiocondylae]